MPGIWQPEGSAGAGRERASTRTSILFTQTAAKSSLGGQNKEIQVLEAATGKLLAQLTIKQPEMVIAISSDGRSLLCTPNDQAAIWRDLSTGRERAEYPESTKSHEVPWLARFGQQMRPPCCARFADGSVAALRSNQANLCPREQAGPVKVLFERELNSISCLALSADGRSLAVAGDDPFVLMLDATSGKAIKQLEADRQDLTALTFSPDGKLLAAGTNRGNLLLWDTSSGKRIAERTGHRGAIRKIAFTADGKHMITAGGADTTAVVWDVAALSTTTIHRALTKSETTWLSLPPAPFYIGRSRFPRQFMRQRSKLLLEIGPNGIPACRHRNHLCSGSICST